MCISEREGFPLKHRNKLNHKIQQNHYVMFDKNVDKIVLSEYYKSVLENKTHNQNVFYILTTLPHIYKTKYIPIGT